MADSDVYKDLFSSLESHLKSAVLGEDYWKQGKSDINEVIDITLLNNDYIGLYGKTKLGTEFVFGYAITDLNTLVFYPMNFGNDYPGLHKVLMTYLDDNVAEDEYGILHEYRKEIPADITQPHTWNYSLIDMCNENY